jgi:hypothetical protein
MARLPLVDSDQDQWGTILNDYLSVTLASDGTLAPIQEPLEFTDTTGKVRASFTSVSGDLWFMVNAYWNPSTQNFYRIDNTHAAFGYQLQAVGLIPGEPNLGFYVAGATMWVAQPMPYDLIRGGGNLSSGIFGAVGGWELGWTVTQERQLTVGGGGIEIDGYGTIPYGRVLNNVTDTTMAKRLVGMCQNAYTDFGGYDDSTQESWYWGYVQSYNPTIGPPYPQVPGTSHWGIAYVPPNTLPGSAVWTEYLSVSATGYATVLHDPTTALGVATKNYVDTHGSGVAGARGGEAFFTGDGTTRTFFQAHGLGALPSRVHLTALNQASLNSWYTKDTTLIGINYATAPANGVAIGVGWTAFP